MCRRILRPRKILRKPNVSVLWSKIKKSRIRYARKKFWTNKMFKPR